MRKFPALARALLVACASVAFSGCGSSGSEGTQPSTQCPADIPSADELATTPRDLPNLELWALKFSDGIVADQDIYDRLVSDIAAIDELVPELTDVDYNAPNDGRALGLIVDSPTYEAMQARSYDAWSCLNDAYGASNLSFDDGLSALWVNLTLRGIYDMEQVIKQYAALPGVMSADSNHAKHGSTICLTREGDTWHYVFDQASGDCEAGCIDHKYTHFSSSAAGDVTNLGEPSPDDLQTYASVEACR